MSSRTNCRFADRFARHVGQGRGSDNAGPRRRRVGPARGLWLGGIAWAMGACSLSFPIKDLEPEQAATGAIDKSAALLSRALDHEDWRRARAALAVTLDPQGNGERASWRNPQSGAHGAFTAVGPPFPDQDRVCRRFTGELAAGDASQTRFAGSACRDGTGEWGLREQVVARTT